VAAIDIAELAPWSEYRLPACPWPGFWGFNPTILRVPDDSGDVHAGAWLCVQRCANYHLPGSGAQGNSTSSHNGVAQRIRNRNWLLELDPDGWQAVSDVEICDRSVYAQAAAARGPNAPSAHVLGYEDLRLAWSKADGLVASATTMTCNEKGVLELAVLDLGDDYQIEGVQPLRGPWSERHQKNWMPMLGGDRVRWLYSPEDGGVHDRDGRVCGVHRRVPRAATSVPVSRAQVKAHSTSFQHGAQHVQIMPARHKVTPPRQTPLALRGGTQLVPVPEVGADRYLGLVHACHVTTTKHYWHHVVLVGAAGDLLAMSSPLKLSPQHGIEFAAGLARDPSDSDRVVITYGVEDDSARLAETSLASLVELLEDVA
jgi:hypothetical protein